MSYGQNLPWGLQATKSLISGTYNGQTSPYLIASGYAQNIFKGDLVYISGPASSTPGYIRNLYDYNKVPGSAGNTDYETAPAIGVFNGCSYVTSSATNPIDPASPGRMYWPAGTVTLNGVPATCDIIDDPNVIFNIQTNKAPGLTQDLMGPAFSVLYTAPGGLVSGNTSTGQSSLVLNQDSVGSAANLNVKTIRIVAIAGNYASSVAFPLNYNNAEVIIMNHVYAARPAVTTVQ